MATQRARFANPRARLVLLLSATLWAASCEGREPTEDAGSSTDGVVAPDGDAGDAGSVVDAALPEITRIEGSGPAQAVAPRPEDQTVFASTADKVVADRRIASTAGELVLTGSGLTGATQVSAVGQSGQGTVEFEIQPGGTDTMLRIRFPQELAVAAGGLFLLTVITPTAQVQAQVFFLQGEQGPQGDPGPCSNTVTGDLTVTGHVSAGGDVNASGATFGDLTVTGSIELPGCPSGYAPDPAADPSITVCVNAVTGDEMVRVGDFWIDRYEASVWSNADCSGTQYHSLSSTFVPFPASFPENGNFTAPAYACSLAGVFPSNDMTWFQAQAACAASGKHLCTNAEWQMAAEGTSASSSHPLTNCAGYQLSAAHLRATAQAGATPGGSDSCISMWGAEDMAGNASEFTSDWWIAGLPWQSTLGEIAVLPVDYFPSWTNNLNGTTFQGQGLPAVALRGGPPTTDVGIYMVDLDNWPGARVLAGGPRCCRQR